MLRLVLTKTNGIVMFIDNVIDYRLFSDNSSSWCVLIKIKQPYKIANIVLDDLKNANLQFVEIERKLDNCNIATVQIMLSPSHLFRIETTLQPSTETTQALILAEAYQMTIDDQLKQQAEKEKGNAS